MNFLKWIKNLFRKPKPEQNMNTLENRINLAIEKTNIPIQKGIVHACHVGVIRQELEKYYEEQIKADFLPSPQTKRKTRTHSYTPPAEQHRQSISKFMKGKASNRYLRTIKQSPRIRIEDED